MLGAGHALARKLRNRMKTLLGLAALGVATAVGLGATLGLCATSSAAPATSPDIPPWGFDLAGRDTAVAPGTDFYGYANGDLRQEAGRSRRTVRATARSTPCRRSPRRASTPSSRRPPRITTRPARKARSAPSTAPSWTSGAPMRWARGRSQPELAAIRAADTRPALARLMGEGAKGFYAASSTSMSRSTRRIRTTTRSILASPASACRTATTTSSRASRRRRPSTRRTSPRC